VEEVPVLAGLDAHPAMIIPIAHAKTNTRNIFTLLTRKPPPPIF
jgi:hypothetical protein